MNENDDLRLGIGLLKFEDQLNRYAKLRPLESTFSGDKLDPLSFSRAVKLTPALLLGMRLGL